MDMMKKIAMMAISLFLLTTVSAVAEGGGGIEYLGNAGSDGLPALAGLLSGEVWLDIPTGAIAGFGGFGYGVTRDNFKIGGFGFGYLSGDISKVVPVFGKELVKLAGGFGGVILGTQASAGPIVIALNTRLGAGGLAVNQRSYPLGDGGQIYTFGTAAFYGSLEIEAGLTLNRIMLISAYAGASGILALTFWEPPVLPLIAPIFGVRITWGSF